MRNKLAISFILVLFLAACAHFNLDFGKLDIPEKKYQFAQEEWVDALIHYQNFLAILSLENQAKIHEKYDEAIKVVDQALDVWGASLGSAIAYNDFLAAKNALIRLGFGIFYEEKTK